MKNNPVDRLTLRDDASVREAMRVIEAGEERLCFLVDADNRLVRVISDGDVRRGLLSGFGLDDRVSGLHDRRPIVVRAGMSAEEARAVLNRRILAAPIVDDHGRVTGIFREHDALPILDIRSRDVTVVGLGYVGLTLALILADNGFSVQGFDANATVREKLGRKEAPFFEAGLQNYLDAHVGHAFRLIDALERSSSDIYIISVGTPVDKTTHKPRTTELVAASRAIGKVLKKGDLVVLRSTVPLGCTRDVVKPAIEEVSGLRAGEDFFLAFCPERTAEGRALEELRKLPQIVGGYCPRSTELALRLFNENTHTVIDVGSLEGAEMCKLLDNTFRDTVFAYANQMAALAETMGLNFVDLVQKVNLGYSRNAIPLPSPGVGGPCLSKDPYILMDCFQARGLDSPIIAAARVVNERAPADIVRRAERALGSVGKTLGAAKIFVIGFAFKGHPQTSDLRESTTLWFLDELKRSGGGDVWSYDPVVEAGELAALGTRPCSLEEGFAGADAVFVMNNHQSYGDMRLFELLNLTRKPTFFYDGWQVFRPADVMSVAGIMYAGMGVG